MIPEAKTIWIISKYFSAAEYGFETRFVAIARKWASAGRLPVVISSDSNHLATFPPLLNAVVDEVIDGVRFRWLRTLRYKRTASFLRVLGWLHFEINLLRSKTDQLPHPDVIIISSLSLFTVLNGVRLSKALNVPWVFEVRDIWPLVLIEEGGFSKWNPLSLMLGAIEKIGYRRANAVVGTMPNLGEHVEEVTGRKLDVKCFPFGCDLGTQRRFLTIPDRSGPLVIGYAGSIGLSNALDTLIECVIKLRHDPRFRFVILGEGDLRQKYMNETAHCPNINWVGRVPRDQVHSLLSGCHVLYFAAHDSKVWRYGMSLNKMVDYLLTGRPIIASYSGYRSILNEAECGSFVASGDGAALLAEFLFYEQLPLCKLDEMGQRGRSWFESNRTWQKIAEDYGRFLDEVVADFRNKRVRTSP